MDISIFGEIKDITDEKLIEIGVKYVNKYYPSIEQYEKNPTRVNEFLQFTYGKMVDLIEILSKNKTQTQKIRAYRQEIRLLNKYVNCNVSEVYDDLNEIYKLLEN